MSQAEPHENDPDADGAAVEVPLDSGEVSPGTMAARAPLNQSVDESAEGAQATGSSSGVMESNEASSEASDEAVVGETADAHGGLSPSGARSGGLPPPAELPGGTPAPVASDPSMPVIEISPDATDATLPPGTSAGEYRVEALIGAGAFGDVYRARHPVIGKAVAVKVLKLRYSADPRIVSRFVAEARAVNHIGHGNIIDIFAFGRLTDGRQYYVMELLKGQTLKDLLEAQGALSLKEALEVLKPMGSALDAAHEAGIAHRDLKPANIFLVRDHDRWRPKLLDFGVAKLMNPEELGQDHQTRTGAAVGTPAYMAPEQCLGKGVTHRADIYAFGVVAFQLLSGKLPFMADSAFSMMSAHIHEPPPDLQVVVTGVPQRAVRVVARMLEKDPESRPSTLTRALEEMEQALDEADDIVPATSARVSVTDPGSMELVDIADLSVKPRSRTPMMVAAVAVVALIGGLVAWRMGGEPAGSGASSGAAAIGASARPAEQKGPEQAASAEKPPAEQPTAAVAAPPAGQPSGEQPPADKPSEPVARPDPAPVAAPPAQNIQLTLTGLPEKAEVIADGQAISPGEGGTLRLPRGDAAIKLAINAPGYEAGALTITPDQDQTHEVSMTRSRKATPGRRSRRRSGGRSGGKPENTGTGNNPGANDLEPW